MSINGIIGKAVMVLAIMVFAQEVLSQDQGEIRAFTNAAFGSNKGLDGNGFRRGVGLNAGLEYFLLDNISINPSVNHYFKSSSNELNFGVGNRNFFLTSTYINLDGKYYLDLETGDLQTYGLFGLSRLKSEYIVQGTTSTPASTKYGLSLGFGAVLLTGDFWNIMSEFRYATPEGDDGTPSGGSTILSIGLLYTFD